MSEPGGLYSSTLQEITNTKLDELTKKHKTYEARRQQAIASARAAGEPIQQLIALAKGVKHCFNITTVGDVIIKGRSNNRRLETDLINLERFLKQAVHDPSVSINVLDTWRLTLVHHLNVQSLKFSFASLYGQLTTEWLQSTKAAPASIEEDAEMGGFEQLPGSNKMENRVKWEQAVFQSADVKEEDVTKMLNAAFAQTDEDFQKSVEVGLKYIRKAVQLFETDLGSVSEFTYYNLLATIQSLMTSDLLSDAKRAVLKDFENNSAILNEVVDVLNMRLAALGSWGWGDSVLLEERRRLNGTISIYMDEDLLQAIFLHHIGIRWSVCLNGVLDRFRRLRRVWKTQRSSVPAQVHKRRENILDLSEGKTLPSVASKKQALYREKFFLSQLLSSHAQQVITQEGEEEAEPMRAAPRKQLASKAARKSAPSAHPKGGAKRHRRVLSDRVAEDGYDSEFDEEEPETGDRKPMEAKQTLLHLISTDVIIKTRLHGEITCFRSQIDEFYSSVPHATVIAVLRFFGVSDRWLNFFKRFLAAPLRFEGEQEPRIRKRGIPACHSLSDVFGQLVLFPLDYRVNSLTSGEPLWRMNEDFWFWSESEDRCVDVWNNIQSMTRIMGLTLSANRGGSVHIKYNKDTVFQAAPVKKPLPEGDIRWGMLYLNPNSGRFEIDQAMVDHHITELGRQLQEQSKSVFSWIQVWNTYAATFFTSNFGTPANCYGREHVDNMLNTHSRIQRELLPGENGIIGHLKTFIEQRFGIQDIPDAYFYFPIELGGLEAQNPFIPLLQVRNEVTEHPSKRMDVFLEAEKDAYRAAKKSYEDSLEEDEEDPAPFMTAEEFSQYREELGHGYYNELVDTYEWLMKRPRDMPVDITEGSPVAVALSVLNNSGDTGAKMSDNVSSIQPYWKWVAQLYGPELIEKFGGFRIVDPGVLPMGMVNMFRSGRVKWQD